MTSSRDAPGVVDGLACQWVVPVLLCHDKAIYAEDPAVLVLKREDVLYLVLYAARPVAVERVPLLDRNRIICSPIFATMGAAVMAASTAAKCGLAGANILEELGDHALPSSGKRGVGRPACRRSYASDLAPELCCAAPMRALPRSIRASALSASRCRFSISRCCAKVASAGA